MDIAIVGLPSSGKTTIFNAVTGAEAPVGTYGSGGKPNIGVAKVPDTRLQLFQTVFEPKKTVPAEITYVDLPPPPDGFAKALGISGENLNHLQRADALMVVVRAFEDRSVPHVDDSVSPARDLETMRAELAFADLGILDRRLSRVAEGFKGAKAPERDTLEREQALLSRLKEALDGGTPVREQTLTRDEAHLLAGFQLLTAKPLMVVVNIGEGQVSGSGPSDGRLAETAYIPTASLCGALEMELASMDPEEEHEFRESLELGESGVDRAVRLSSEAMDLITFFTGNDNEVRAWPVTVGTTAVEAAGKVHSDFERGFIRAEVVAHADLEECGSLAEARRRGVLRQEGKDYRVSDGDLLNILFSV